MLALMKLHISAVLASLLPLVLLQIEYFSLLVILRGNN